MPVTLATALPEPDRPTRHSDADFSRFLAFVYVGEPAQEAETPDQQPADMANVDPSTQSAPAGTVSVANTALVRSAASLSSETIDLTRPDDDGEVSAAGLSPPRKRQRTSAAQPVARTTASWQSVCGTHMALRLGGGANSARPRRQRNVASPRKPSLSAISPQSITVVNDTSSQGWQALQKALRSRRRIVAFVGAGISVGAGIPDFSTLAGKKSVFARFSISVYDSDNTTKDFHDHITKLHNHIAQAVPTPFHRWLSHLASRRSLTRLWTQNVDGIEENFDNLSACKTPDAERFPRTVRLHGALNEMVCQQDKTHRFQFEPKAFTGPTPRDCPLCVEIQSARVSAGKRRSACLIGKLRPSITLYDECEDGLDIAPILKHDFSKRRSPDCILIVGTRLKTPGARQLLSQICRNAKGHNKACLIIYIDTKPRSLGRSIDSWIDYRVEADCQVFAEKALQW